MQHGKCDENFQTTDKNQRLSYEVQQLFRPVHQKHFGVLIKSRKKKHITEKSRPKQTGKKLGGKNNAEKSKEPIETEDVQSQKNEGLIGALIIGLSMPMIEPNSVN